MDTKETLKLSDLDDYQIDAVNRMKNGCILCGGVGSGKSRTALAYYVKDCKDNKKKIPLIIITTAKKRDSGEWEEECGLFGIPIVGELTVDSWNNISKYKEEIGCFFIFDEQRVVGSGQWVKSFLKIVKRNRWILLSATPGDTWKDYIPVFIANGFYKNRTEFSREHIVYSQFTTFPKIDRYLQTARLERLRDSILVNMDYKKKTEHRNEDIYTDYNGHLYKTMMKTQWNPWTDEPINTAGELCYALRHICNSDPTRLDAVERIIIEHPKAIIFYNFDYELEMLRAFCLERNISYAEWNGHKHEKIPEGKKWLYLVQYTAGAEGWNCTTTDTVIFYSQNYSYKVLVQASGRIDRRNTPYDILYYYHLKSRSSIDLAIARALKSKKQFNERGFVENGTARKAYKRELERTPVEQLPLRF